MKCAYCNQDAGFLKRQHEQCHDAHETGVAHMIDLSAAAALGKRSAAGLVADLQRIASASYVPADSLHGLMAQGWIAGLNSVLDERLLTGSEQAALGAYLNQFRFLMSVLQSAEGGVEAMEQLRQAVILRDMVGGKMPDPPAVESRPHTVQPDEIRIPRVRIPGCALLRRQDQARASWRLDGNLGPGSERLLCKKFQVPQPHRGDGSHRTRRYRRVGTDHQAYLLLRPAQEIQSAIRQDRILRLLSRRTRDHARRPNGQAPEIRRGRQPRLVHVQTWFTF